VGSGPFPTELHDGIGEQIREQGKEYGTVTGRGRRCGWLDLVALRQSARLNSLSGLVVTRLDVLCGIENLKACTAYKLDGKEINHLPADIDDVAKVEPVYEEFEGWGDGLRSVRSLSDLPQATQKYLQFVEAYTKTPAAILSIGPERDVTIMLRPDLIWA
jgi:adenylosuccinate synthase